MTAHASPDLKRGQLAWLAFAVVVVSAGYGALMPLLPGWLGRLMAAHGQSEVVRHVGLISGAYAAGVLIGAPMWGMASDRLGRRSVLIVGMLGYVASTLLLLAPERAGLVGVYALRASTGLFVAAVVPVVSALVAESTPQIARAQRFAWLSAMSLVGFLIGPGVMAVGGSIVVAVLRTDAETLDATQPVILLSALLGGVAMLGLAVSLRDMRVPVDRAQVEATGGVDDRRAMGLWLLNGTVMFVLAGFELGIVMQDRQHVALSPADVSLMFAECSLVMLGVNVALFWTRLLERAAGAGVIAVGIALAVSGLAVLGQHRGIAPMYLGVSLTAAGTGLVLPTVAYLAAGASQRRLGRTMGGLTAAAGLGQTIGSAASGWLFGLVAQVSFTWLSLPLLATLGLLLARPDWWSRQADPRGASRAS